MFIWGIKCAKFGVLGACDGVSCGVWIGPSGRGFASESGGLYLSFIFKEDICEIIA